MLALQGSELLTSAEMAAADRYAVAAGVPFLRLMENAGRAVADAATRMLAASDRILVLCGPGNNGGDGFVAARLLHERGYRVRVALLGPHDALRGDAARMAALWQGPVEPLAAVATADAADLAIDAIFGAGLSRPLGADVLLAAAELRRARVPVLAVDIPSGIHGDTGASLGGHVQATCTVTFFRMKPGHLLLPGRRAVGRVVVADIGIAAAALAAIGPRTWRNGPSLWTDHPAGA